jgi:hypothetical protein
MAENEINTGDVEAPTHLDGTPVDKEEAARMHAGLVSGEISIIALPEAAAELEALGISMDDIRQQMIASTRKTMS